eukprot:TRINITY_DN1215_c1_g1_i1.p1 TRINITY_DN1215_c1_g1~~TRINITY_DN1215_c1_g1_i1.p1  ORF type:complete len:131 (+),score=23.57 TRINITY_DN1215_c1_g1_i1:52-444(+)
MGCTSSKPKKSKRPANATETERKKNVNKAPADEKTTEQTKEVSPDSSTAAKKKKSKVLPPPLLPPQEDTVSRQASMGDSNTFSLTNAAVKDHTTDLLTPCSFHFNETFPPNSPSVGSRNSECIRQPSTVS